METKRTWTTSLPFRVVSFAALPVLLVYLAVMVDYCGGWLRFYVEVDNRVLLFGPPALAAAALLLVVQGVSVARRETEGMPRWREWCTIVLICAVVIFGALAVHGFGGARYSFGQPETPYISQGVLPLMEQMEEENPDFSVQKALPDTPPEPGVADGFVEIQKCPLRHNFLILRQDAADGAWYHILYWEFLSEKIAADYAAIRLQEEPEGAEVEPVGDAFYWKTPEGWEVMQAQQGRCLVQVTYDGPLEFRPLVETWSEAIFPG